MKIKYRVTLSVLSLFLILNVTAQSKPHTNNLGDVIEFNQNGNIFDIATSNGAVVQIQIINNDIFRIWVSPKDSLINEDSHSAPIVILEDSSDVKVQLEKIDDYHAITTNSFSLRIYTSSLRFALYNSDKSTLIWKELKPIHLSENESYQTLSSHANEKFFGGGQQNGSFEFKGRVMHISYSGWEEGDRPNPAPFYMSNKGYGVLRNSWTDGEYDFFSTNYLTATHNENRFDAYYFVGQSINHLVDLYTQLTGRASLLPRWAYEYGDADCYNDGDNIKKPGTVPDGWSDGPTGTTPDVIESVASNYRKYDMPGGWILPNDGYGCGYVELPSVVERLQKYGFYTGLWTENGVEKIAWEVGKAGTRAQKLDVAWTGKGYQFAMDANKDASQGILDNSDSRPFVWTVMGWAGIQRYAVTWTGDQSGSWDFIRWHIPTLIGSGLSGMIYSTGDVDGIYGGSPETYTRDLQWKCFTPILMGMSGWSKSVRKHPWWFEEPYRSVNRKYLKLKMRLMPYMYTLAREAELTGAPIVRSLMWDYPNDPNAFSENIKYQFFLGKNLLVAPVYRSQEANKGWRDDVYLPEGAWIDYWDGTIRNVGHEGLYIDYPVTLEKLPLFVRAGAILPLYPEVLYDGEKPKDVLTLDIYPHYESEYILYEDDGTTREYKDDKFTEQKFQVSQNDSTINIIIDSVIGNFNRMHEHRVFEFQVHNHTAPKSISFNGQQIEKYKCAPGYNQSTSGWYFDTNVKNGVIFIKTDTISVRNVHNISLLIDKIGYPVSDSTYPTKEPDNGLISADNLLIVNRPTEEEGHPLENAFDGNPDTWFRTVRGQSVSYGPHEFVLSLKERQVIDGFKIAPRNDKWWEWGNVYEYEIYMSDINGVWGDPILRDTLVLSDSMQTIRFDPSAGSLVRFRILSTHKMKDESGEKSDDATYDALAPQKVSPITISEFHLIKHKYDESQKFAEFLSHPTFSEMKDSTGLLKQHHMLHDNDSSRIQMNNLKFLHGLAVQGNSRIDYKLDGDFLSFRAETGIDDTSPDKSEIRFQVFGNEKLLYQTSKISGDTIEKFEIDIRGVKILSLRTIGTDISVIANWANPKISGFTVDKLGK